MSKCSDESHNIDFNDALAQLKRLSAAEEFFAVLGVSYDPKVLDVSRLHIMKRMGQYLADEDLSGLPGQAIAARTRAMLERAYEDFATSPPLTHRVFKVLKDHDPGNPTIPPTAFVSLETILKPFRKE
ncbi:nitrogenase stabilizing/protective protein NifW [Allorhizobium undicola]|uniref:nitrogenase stabilizing/protective protein NifW n=1 Tax=Allorhizobium undicola TaxID=78527 RepID=UPI000486BB3B|nr:nitrogenase stabilizing/protective protein NifW [Allorhizobium undicola]